MNRHARFIIVGLHVAVDDGRARVVARVHVLQRRSEVQTHLRARRVIFVREANRFWGESIYP